MVAPILKSEQACACAGGLATSGVPVVPLVLVGLSSVAMFLVPVHDAFGLFVELTDGLKICSAVQRLLSVD